MKHDLDVKGDFHAFERLNEFKFPDFGNP